MNRFFQKARTRAGSAKTWTGAISHASTGSTLLDYFGKCGTYRGRSVGEVNADIVQKKPIARVSTNASYYIDDQGTFMPLSDNHSARVPLVTGHIDKNNLNNVFTMANKIQNDEFLKKNVVEIHQDINKTIYLRLRQCSFKAEMGDINNLDKKINNLKAFYKKSLKEKTLNNYSNVNLQFDNQVVCTKL